MATIFVDQKPHQVTDGQNLLSACLALGLNLPYFCWHPAMGSVGACRQCAVKQFRDQHDTRGRLVMACMTAASEGARISIEDPEARAFRASVIEWMMLNHPHDCPVCDEGSECHLQDMTVMTGHTYRRYRGLKRTFLNQDLGPFVNHEMNRCIQCYRCVRFYRDYAGGRDFDAFVLRNLVYFGRGQDGILESEFSGNLVEVCPTGVFDDKTFKEHYTRKWDLQTAPSVCVHCGLGCNTIPAERYGLLRRVRNRYNGQVNGYFLCDRGRYGYEFVNSDRRIRHSLVRADRNKAAEPAAREAALQQVGAWLRDSSGVIGIGSPRASLEANFALRALVGPDHFYLGMSDNQTRLVTLMLDILQTGPARSPALRDVERADAALVLGEDVSNVAPMLALALRQAVRNQPMQKAQALHIPAWDDAAVREAVQNETGPLFLATPDKTRLDDAATSTFHAGPDDLARLGFAVARALDPHAPPVPDLPEALGALAERIAQALLAAKRPLIIAGPSLGSEAIVQAAANIAWALHGRQRPADLCFTMPECNSLGLALLGGRRLGAAFEAARQAAPRTILILENDLSRRADAASVQAFLDAAKHVIVLDHLATTTTARADVVLPASTFAEGDGTLVNNEGRAQRFFSVFAPQGDIQASWRWLREIACAAGSGDSAPWRNLDQVTAALAKSLPIFEPVQQAAPPAGFRIAGQKIAREPQRYSGRTAMSANLDVSEPKPPDDPDSALAFSMEGYQGQPPPALVPRFWSPGWNSIQALNKFQSEIGGPLRGGDPGQRLIEPAPGERPAYFADVPAAFTPREGEWLLLPLYHLFGSEELSLLTPGVAQQAPRPYLALSAHDAAKLRVKAGDLVDLSLLATTHPIPVTIRPAMPDGIAGLPSGWAELPWPSLPAYARLSRLSPA
ncbi:MAG: NADH-quinone oxidoreductase subunit NuoG [Anaerolineales bacterium]|nr:NADH-quinone oxidoreductase subunit NuoG [Anaerolineales bacterium]